MAAMLSARGFQVDAVQSGPEAIEQIQRRKDAALEPYQVIVLDWQMPGMDGWETAQQIRATPCKTPPLLIMVTANGRQLLSQRTREEQSRLNGFLAKPVSASMLLEAVANAYTDGATTPLVRQQGSSLRRLNGMRVLVVEDNLLNQQVAEELLSKEGALVALAANGQIGADAVAAATVQFDAVLMDLQMPVLDGYGATRLIREQLGFTELPVIALSANTLPRDRSDSLAAGMTEHVGKPFDISKLVEILVRVTGWASRSYANVSGLDHDHTVPIEVEHAEKYSDVIDVAGALAWVGDDIQMYRRFLTSFLDDVRTYADQLKTHLEHDERSDATRILHTLKGLARTVGALELSRFSAEAEIRLKQPLTTEETKILVMQTRDQITSTTQELLLVADRIDSATDFDGGTGWRKVN